MRTTIKKKTKVISLAICLTAILAGGLSFATNSNNQLADTKQLTGECEVTDAEIITYLQGYGYTNVSVSWLEYPNCTRLAHSDYSYDTFVYCTETAIINHEDLDLK